MADGFVIREEESADIPAVFEVNRLAFGGEVEPALVDRLRADGDVALSLVAIEGGTVVGYVLFSRLPIETAEGTLDAVALAPIAVRPGRQRDGIGSALIRRGLALCRDRGAVAAVVLGHRDYYPRFGFSPELARTIDAPYAGTDAFMALELVPGALVGRRGTARYASAFSELG